jgi:hypothetical protein
VPTGYTAYIEDGDITTGKDFLKLCTRAMGIAMDIRDENLSVPTPTHFEPDNYYKEQYEKALDEFIKNQNMTFEEAALQMKKSHVERVTDYRKLAEKMTERNKKYQKVRDEVESWVPPTDEHKGLKKFALEQIDMCMDKPKTIEDCIEASKEEFEINDEAVREYMKYQLDLYKQDVDRAYERYQAELERTKEKNEWMKQLIQSLENM